MFQYLLNHCSSTLEDLILDINSTYDEDKMEQDKDEPAPSWTFHRLNLFRCVDKSDSKTFWPWLWERCGPVDQLVVRDVTDIIHCLVEGMLNHMPKLNKIALRGGNFKCLADEEVAALLSSSHNGWKDVDMKHVLDFGQASKEALMKQYSTIESMSIDGCDGFTSEDMVQALSSSPNLRTLIDVDYGTYRVGRLHANIFIDQDPETELLRPWVCEASLKEFRVRISGIARPELRDCKVKETYPGEGRKVQSQVHDRLARLTNLEILWLGNRHVLGNQDDCLDMSLESGLHKLATLKKLKELSVSGMTTRIGVKEVQWIADQWPKLRVIYGLEKKGHNEEAARWLREYRPEIKLRDSK